MSRQRSVKPDISRRVSQNLKCKRRELGYSRKRMSQLIAEQSGVQMSAMVIRYIENGISEGAERPRRVRIVSIDEAALLAETLGLSIEELTHED